MTEPRLLRQTLCFELTNLVSVTQRQVILYLGDVKPGDVLNFEYTLKPKYPLRARTPSSTAYEYYTPSNRAESRPVELVVEETKK